MGVRCPRIIMVGSFPLPVHGMAVVNAAMRNALQEAVMMPQVIDVAAPSLSRSLMLRVGVC